jgi:hypothetical protein
MWVTRYPLGLSGRPSSPWPPSSSTRFLHSRHCALPHSPSSVQFGRPFSPLSRLPRSSPLRLSAAGRRHKPRYSAFFRSRTRNCAACSGLHATPRRFRLSKSPPAAFHLHRAPIVVDSSRRIARRSPRVSSEPFLPLARRRFRRSLSVALPSPSTLRSCDHPRPDYGPYLRLYAPQVVRRAQVCTLPPVYPGHTGAPWPPSSCARLPRPSEVLCHHRSLYGGSGSAGLLGDFRRPPVQPALSLTASRALAWASLLCFRLLTPS